MTRDRRPKQPTDPVVLGVFLGWLGGIFVTDYLFVRFRKSKNGAPNSYTGNTRNVRLLQIFFWYLALHMTRQWWWDPLTIIQKRIEASKMKEGTGDGDSAA